MVDVDFFYATDTGKVRNHNEDSVIIVKNLSGEYLMAVADGMGGHNAGEIASEIAISNISRKWGKLESIGDKKQAAAWLKQEAKEITNLILDRIELDPRCEGMGTTLVAAIITRDYIIVGNVGDSRAYILKDEDILQVTTDHTLVNMLVQSGEINSLGAHNHPQKNVLMRALGAGLKSNMDIFEVSKEIDGLLLCSDGLTEMLTNREIYNILTANLEIDDKVMYLIKTANKKGGTDNISVAYIEMGVGE